MMTAAPRLKAVIPVAGLGTRMLPATKAIPKEMLPVVDKPLIQYVVNEAVSAGIKDIVLVTHSSKNSIENHFDKSFELEAILTERVKRTLLEEIQSIIPSDVHIMHIRQGEALGLADALRCAMPLIGEDKPFAVLLPDVILANHSADQTNFNLAEMVARFIETGSSQIMIEEVPADETHKYGIVDLNGANPNDSLFTKIHALVEKPRKGFAPSNYAITGRYILSKKIWRLFDETPIGVGGELQLTDTLRKLLEHETVEAYVKKGYGFDCGTKIGYMQANVDYALRHPTVADEFKKYLIDLVKNFEVQ